MFNIRRSLVILSLAVFATACHDSPTEPVRSLKPSNISIAIVPDPTLVTFNSALCTLNSASTGDVSCTWIISNPNQTHLNLSLEATMNVTYDCVNPHNGRLQSTQTRELSTFATSFDVSDATLSGSNIGLPVPFLPIDYRGSQKKENACKGNTVPENLTWSLVYWDVAVFTISGIQRASCFGSDNRFGCFTS